MKLIMFSFCWNTLQKYQFKLMVILEAVNCGAVELHCVTLRGVSNILSTAHE